MDLNHPAINAMGQGWHLIEEGLPSKQNRPKEPGPLLLAKVHELLDEQKVKQASEIKGARATHVVTDIWKDKKQLSHYYPRGKYWGAAGGKIEKGEPEHKAAARELLERTGFKIKPGDLIWRGRKDDTEYFIAPFDKLKQRAEPGTLGGYKTKLKWVDRPDNWQWYDSVHEAPKIKKASLKDIAFVKQAFELKYRQHPTADQVARQPSAVVIQGDQTLIKGNHRAKKFYEDIAEYIRGKGYTVQVAKQNASGEAPKADVVVAHGGLQSNKVMKVLNIPQYPSPFVTKSLLAALDKLVAKK